MAGAAVQSASEAPRLLKSALKKGTTRQKRQVVIDEARNTYCEATCYFLEEVPLSVRARRPTLDRVQTTRTQTNPESSASDRPSNPPHGGNGSDSTPKTIAGETRQADVDHTISSEVGRKCPSPQTLVTALLTDSLLALTPADSKVDLRQIWRPNLPDLVTESVEGDDRGKEPGSPPKLRSPDTASPLGFSQQATSGTTAPTTNGAQDKARTTESSAELRHEELEGGSAAAPSTPPAFVSAPIEYLEVSPELPMPVFLSDAKIDCCDVVGADRNAARDACEDERRDSARDPPATTKAPEERSHASDGLAPSGSEAGRAVELHVAAPSAAGDPGAVVKADYALHEDGTDLDEPYPACAQAGSPDRFWSVSVNDISSSIASPLPEPTSLPENGRLPTQAVGSLPPGDNPDQGVDSPRPVERTWSSSPERRSPPELVPVASAGGPQPPQWPAFDRSSPSVSTDSYSLDDIEDALHEPRPWLGPNTAAGGSPASGSPPESPPPAGEGRERAAVDSEDELVGFVELQAARTERLRRRYTAGDDGGFTRRPAVRGVVVQTALREQHLHHPQHQQHAQPPVPTSSEQHTALNGYQHVQLYPQQSADMSLRHPGLYQQQPNGMHQQPRQVPPQGPSVMHPQHPDERTAPGHAQTRGWPPTYTEALVHMDPNQLMAADSQQFVRHNSLRQSDPQTTAKQPQTRPTPHLQPEPKHSRSQHPPFQHDVQPQHKHLRLQHLQHQPQYLLQQQITPQISQISSTRPTQLQSESAPAATGARPLPLAQTRGQQLAQIRRLQSAHMVRLPGVTIGFPDAHSQRYLPRRWHVPEWLPDDGVRLAVAVNGGSPARAHHARSPPRGSRGWASSQVDLVDSSECQWAATATAPPRRATSQQQLHEPAGRRSSLAAPQPRDRAPPPVAPSVTPQEYPQYRRAAAPPPAATLPRRRPASAGVALSRHHPQLGSTPTLHPGGPPSPPWWHEPTADERYQRYGTLPRHHRPGEALSPQVPTPPRGYQQTGSTQQQRQWKQQQPRWHEPSAQSQTTSVPPHGYPGWGGVGGPACGLPDTSPHAWLIRPGPSLADSEMPGAPNSPYSGPREPPQHDV